MLVFSPLPTTRLFPVSGFLSVCLVHSLPIFHLFPFPIILLVFFLTISSLMFSLLPFLPSFSFSSCILYSFLLFPIGLLFLPRFLIGLFFPSFSFLLSFLGFSTNPFTLPISLLPLSLFPFPFSSYVLPLLFSFYSLTLISFFPVPIYLFLSFFLFCSFIPFFSFLFIFLLPFLSNILSIYSLNSRLLLSILVWFLFLLFFLSDLSFSSSFFLFSWLFVLF